MRSFLIAIWLFVASAVAHAAPPILAPSTFNDGTAVDSAPLGTRLPLILIHGLGGTGQGWEHFLRSYAANASWRSVLKPYTFRYTNDAPAALLEPTTPATLSGLGKSLRDAVQYFYDVPEAAPTYGFGDRSVVILAHSMGGLVARSMMQEYAWRDGRRGGERVLHLITLGTPHHGSPLADATHYYGISLIDEMVRTNRLLIRDMVWTNYDAVDLPSRVCNPWLATLNTYDPAVDAYHAFGECGPIRTVRKRGFYERIVAYGARRLQARDVRLGWGVYKPGSALQLMGSYTYLRESLPRSYENDGIVPLASAHFEGKTVFARKEAFACDHRYMERGYVELVRTEAGGYSDFAACAASNADVVPSGVQDGRAVGNTIFGAPGGIVDVVRTASQVQRVFRWAEAAHADKLQPVGAVTDIVDGGYQRAYPASQSLVQIKDGGVFYTGPETNQVRVRLGSLAQYLLTATNAGY